MNSSTGRPSKREKKKKIFRIKKTDGQKQYSMKYGFTKPFFFFLLSSRRFPSFEFQFEKPILARMKEKPIMGCAHTRTRFYKSERRSQIGGNRKELVINDSDFCILYYSMVRISAYFCHNNWTMVGRRLRGRVILTTIHNGYRRLYCRIATYVCVCVWFFFSSHIFNPYAQISTSGYCVRAGADCSISGGGFYNELVQQQNGNISCKRY